MTVPFQAKLPSVARKYLQERQPHWSEQWHYDATRHLRHLYRWLDRRTLAVDQLTPKRLQTFFRDEYPARSRSGPPAAALIAIRGYLIWLGQSKNARIDPEALFPEYCELWDRSLPSLAERFYQERAQGFVHPMSHSRLIYAVNRLHRWMKKNKVSVKELQRPHLERFLKDFIQAQPYTASSLHSFCSNVRIYLDWLIDHGHMNEADLSGIFPAGKNKYSRKLSKNARRYLALQEGTKRPSACARIQYVLGSFYFFLHENGFLESRIDRLKMELWLQSLAKRGLAPSTRTACVLELRNYFYWLQEQGLLKRDPADLLRRTDLAKRPKLLPRPIPPEIDRELIQRLESSDELLQQGLLLLRYTGIRIGEMIALPWACVKQDFNGNWTLKVPIGKLNSERLVPLDPKTLQLIRDIQEKTKSINQLRSDDVAHWALFPRSHSKQTLYMHLRSKLAAVCRDIPTPEPIAAHRLRHTYATSLLNAGMSLSSVMRILGHHSITTTLIYAAVAQETVREEFVTAVDKIQNRYRMPGAATPQAETRDGLTGISDAIRWLHLQADIADSGANRKAELLLKRLHRVKSELQELKKRID